MTVWVLIVWLSGAGVHRHPEVMVFGDRGDCEAVLNTARRHWATPGECVARDVLTPNFEGGR